jgi:four helix bundle protein
MARVARFEDLIAWRKGRALAQRIYPLTQQGAIARDSRLRDQLRGTLLSITGNIAEGFERHRAAEFHQFLSVAKASCAELRSHLYLACDAGYLSAEELAGLLALAEEVAALIGGLRLAVDRKRRHLR